MVEQRSPKPMVAGSSPAAPATSYFAFSATNLYILKKILQDLTMRVLHANVLGITPLKLNSHFAPETSESETTSADHSDMPSELHTGQHELLTLPYQLHADLLLLQPSGFAEIIKGDSVKLQNNVLTLPSVNLTVEHKRALWKLLHDN